MLSKMPIIVNKEKVPEKDLESLTKIRSDTIVSSGTIGFPNFLSMAFLVVVRTHSVNALMMQGGIHRCGTEQRL